MLKFGFMSIGEGGSNIGECAAQKGYPVLAINTAKVDFDKIKTIDVDSRIHLEGWEGAGRNREIGKEAMLTHAGRIYDKAKAKFKDCDMLFVVGTTPGGTGSGGLPVGVEILSDINKRIGVITTLPELNESPKAHMNSLECFSEISQIDYLGSVFSIDNEKARNIYKDIDRPKIYRLANQQIIDNLFEVSSLCSHSSLLSNFDKNDFLGIIEERGSSVITKIMIPIEQIKKSSDIANIIQQSLNQMCNPDINGSQIVKAAVIGKLPSELISWVDTKLIFQNIGTPYDTIEAYYSNKEHQNHCIFYLVLSGLSFPFERLKQMENEINSVEQELMEKVELSRNQKFDTGKWSNKFKKTQDTSSKPSLAERLSRFK